MSFTAELKLWCTKTKPEQLSNTVRIVLMEIGNRVVMRSPVGNPEIWLYKNGDEYVDFLAYSSAPEGYVGGRFRANWQYGFGKPADGELNVIDPSGRGTIAAISNAVKGDVIGINYISNNLPYAQRLEEGWSSQAPQGMVALTELEFTEIVRRAQG